MARGALFFLMIVGGLAGCGSSEPPEAQPPTDPAVAQALNDPLMTDPDLSQRNEGAAALTVTVDSRLPQLPATPEAIAAAQADAARLVGGREKLVRPPEAVGDVPPLPAAWSPETRLVALGAGQCAVRLTATTMWAARMPVALPVYPRGATLAAAGSTAPGCDVRTVRFASPVPVPDVLAFYWTRATASRLSPRHLKSGDTAVVRGTGAGLAFEVRARAIGDQTLVELTTLSR